MKNQGWERSKVTEALRMQINEYVEIIIKEDLPRIHFSGYQMFVQKGKRKEFEEDYFNVRKQLTALSLYLMWNKREEAIAYYNELLWSVTNEFSWCLVAHLRFEAGHFQGESDKIIDLFAAETAATLSEIAVIHVDIIDPMLHDYMISQVKRRVLTPFLEQDWGWETSLNNWCSVCSGSIGMAALQIEEGKRKDDILAKVDRALTYYLRCFGNDGETVEGIGYWGYGFGYYMYYLAMRSELDNSYTIPDEVLIKIKNIAHFPYYTQMSESTYLPFSDADTKCSLPTGLISYLFKEYNVQPPICKEITSFDFEHCYRFAHISRNLWWTSDDIFHHKLSSTVKYFKDAQWLVQRSGGYYLAIKGGTNAEEHNHNDVGSFIFAIDGELLLTDLGAGPYTAGYFGSERYEYPHTRSYWHNLPMIQGQEQIATSDGCQVQEVIIDGQTAKVSMEISKLYKVTGIKNMTRTITSDMMNKKIHVQEELTSKEMARLEEGFISMVKPNHLKEGTIQWKGRLGSLLLCYDTSLFEPRIEETILPDHLGKEEKVYRLGLLMKERHQYITTELHFEYNN